MILCGLRIYNRTSKLYWTTTTENGITFVTLTSNPQAPFWNFVVDEVNQSSDLTPYYRIKEFNSNLFVSPISIDDKIYLCLTKDGTMRDGIFLLSRSGFGQGSRNYNLSLFVMTNLTSFMNINEDGGNGSKIILTTPKQNDDNQRYQLVLPQTFN